ncbi:hypothetical protein GOV08_03580 [Candidatus Woesearchaeota archaeon]|nr:hypothetical protein [Candidatus Woesearchaeota archaeon]
MEEFKTKSAIIGKKGKSDENENYPVFVNLFDVNDPHKDHEMTPKNFLEYKEIHKIVINGLNIEYLLIGKDIVINNLKSIKIEADDENHLIIEGKQE